MVEPIQSDIQKAFEALFTRTQEKHQLDNARMRFSFTKEGDIRIVFGDDAHSRLARFYVGRDSGIFAHMHRKNVASPKMYDKIHTSSISETGEEVLSVTPALPLPELASRIRAFALLPEMQVDAEDCMHKAPAKIARRVSG